MTTFINSISVNRNSVFYLFVCSLFAIVTIISINNVYYNDERWRLFSDCYDYLAQAKTDLFSFNFWFPAKTPTFSPRPFTIPLIYKITGEDISRIVLWQKVIHFLSALLLAISVSLFIKKQLLKYLFSVFICIVFCWWNILGWTQLILSESLSFSFTILWVSSMLFYLRFDKNVLLVLHISIVILFLFTRDSWSYVLILFYTLWMLIAFMFSKNHVRSGLILFLVCCGAFFIQQKAIIHGERQVLPVINNLVVRVVKEPSYLGYFEKKGMPMAADLKNEFGDMDLSIHENRHFIYELYSNKRYKPLFDWASENGKNTYLAFMLSHPSYPLMLKEPATKMHSFFVRNLYEYTREPVGISSHVDFLFPVFSYLALFIFVVVLLFMNIKTRNFIFMIVTALYVAMVANAIIIYNADSLEIERHLFNNSVIVEIFGALFFCFILDNIDYKRIAAYIRTKRTSSE